MLRRINTGVFLDADEFKVFKELGSETQLSFPADCDKGPIPYPEGPWVEVAQLVQKIALEKGLPDIPGFYGIDEEGQFVTYSDIPDFMEDSNEKA